MFAYKISTGAKTNIPKLASMYPTEACVLQVNDALFCHPKEARITHGIFPGLLLASGMTCLSQFEHPFKKKNI